MEKSKKRKLLIIAAVCVVLLIGVVTYMNIPHNDTRQVISSIDSLQDITLESGEELSQIRAAYEDLSDRQKNFVANIDVLYDAEAQLQRLTNVSSQIDSIGEVSIQSGDVIKNAQSAYDSLNEQEKAKINNYPVLEAAAKTYEQIEIASDLNSRIGELNTKAVDSSSELTSLISNIKSTYEKLDDTYKPLVSNWSKLDESISKCVKSSASNMLNEENTRDCLTLLSSFSSYLSNSEKLSLLEKAGKTMCYNNAKSDVISLNSRLNPNLNLSINGYNELVYNRESGEPGSSGEFNLIGSLKCSYTDYFGISRTDTVGFSYNFTVDLENCKISGVKGITF